MRVPVLDPTRVAVGATTSPTQPLLRQPDNTALQVAQVAQQTLGGVAQGVASIDAHRRRLEAEADELAVTNALAGYQRTTTESLYGTPGAEGQEGRPGWLSTRGVEASRTSAEFLDTLEKAREAAAKPLTPRQQQEFARRASTLLEGARQQVLSRVATEVQAAKVEAAKALQESTLQAVFALAVDGTPAAQQALLEQSRLAEESVAAAARTPEGQAAARREFQAKQVAARIAADLQAGRVDGAQAKLGAFETTLAALGPEAVAGIKRQVALQVKGAAIDASRTEAEGLARSIITSARGEDGYTQENVAMRALDSVPDAKRDAVRGQLREMLVMEVDQRRNDVEELTRQAQRAFNEGGLRAIPGSVVARLQQLAPEKYAAFLSDDEARLRHRRADARGDAEARREQKQADTLALVEYRALGPQEMAKTDPEAWATGRGLSPLGVARLKEARTGATGKAADGIDDALNDGTREWRELNPAPRKATSAELEARRLDEATFRAALSDDVEHFIAREKRSPTGAEVKAMAAPLLVDKRYRRAPEGPEAPPPSPTPGPPPPPPEAPMVRVRRKADGKPFLAPADKADAFRADVRFEVLP